VDLEMAGSQSNENWVSHESACLTELSIYCTQIQFDEVAASVDQFVNKYDQFVLFVDEKSADLFCLHVWGALGSKKDASDETACYNAVVKVMELRLHHT
jgi:hypothetical protein